MRFFMVILSFLALMSLSESAVTPPYQSVAQAEEKNLFLLRILAIDKKQHVMLLDMVDGDRDVDEPLIYIFKSVPESLQTGDLIRIWGSIEKDAGTQRTEDMEIAESWNRTEDGAIQEIPIISGTIAGTSYRNGSDPTGVRKRLKRRVAPHQPPSGGGGRAQP